MSNDKFKKIVRNFVERGVNQKEMAAFDEFYSPEFVDHALPPNLPPGLEGRKMFASAFYNAFPDLTITIEDWVVDGQKVAVRQSAQGTHQGDLMGIPATGKSIHISGIFIFRFEGNKVVEQWEIFDQMGMMQQLGIIPA